MALILVADDTPKNLEKLEQAALATGGEVLKASDRDEAIELIRSHDFDVVVTDLALTPRHPQTGLDVLREAILKDPFTQVIMVTGLDETEFSVKAMALGAYDYLVRGTVGINVDAMIRIKIDNALRYRELLRAKQSSTAQG